MRDFKVFYNGNERISYPTQRFVQGDKLPELIINSGNMDCRVNFITPSGLVVTEISTSGKVVIPAEALNEIGLHEIEFIITTATQRFTVPQKVQYEVLESSEYTELPNLGQNTLEIVINLIDELTTQVREAEAKIAEIKSSVVLSEVEKADLVSKTNIAKAERIAVINVTEEAMNKKSLLTLEINKADKNIITMQGFVSEAKKDIDAHTLMNKNRLELELNEFTQEKKYDINNFTDSEKHELDLFTIAKVAEIKQSVIDSLNNDVPKLLHKQAINDLFIRGDKPNSKIVCAIGVEAGEFRFVDTKNSAGFAGIEKVVNWQDNGIFGDFKFNYSKLRFGVDSVVGSNPNLTDKKILEYEEMSFELPKVVLEEPNMQSELVIKRTRGNNNDN